MIVVNKVAETCATTPFLVLMMSQPGHLFVMTVATASKVAARSVVRLRLFVDV